MSIRILQAGMAAGVVAIVACSSTTEPAAAPDCVVVDGSICGTTVVGGSSSGAEAGVDGGSSCSVTAGDSQCGVCAGADCCSELEACSNSIDCTNLDSCEENCTGGTACDTGCQQSFPTGVATLNQLTSCLAVHCPVCTESGLGDPCGPGYYPCEPNVGLTCNGLWCTESCVATSTCAGIGASGTNSLGYTNSCMVTSHGEVCTPGCGSGTGCTDFPGTYCYATTAANGTAVSVCTLLPDASTGG